MMFSVFVFILSSVSVVECVFCRGGYDAYDAYCYAVLPVKASWAEAQQTGVELREKNTCKLMKNTCKMMIVFQQYCKAAGGSLAVIENKNESQFVHGLLQREHNQISTGQIWIGGMDLLQEGQWLAPETLTPLTYFNWAPGEPDNLGGQHCLAIFNHDNLRWDDNRCEVLNYALCKTEGVVNENIVG